MKKVKTTQPKPKKKNSKVNYPLSPMLAALAVGLVTFVVFYPSISNGFINWDDPSYVINNTRLRDLGLGTIIEMFNPFPAKYLVSNYHPLTELSLAIDYSVFGKGARGFHMTNWFLHTANSVLVFFFVLRLFKGRVMAALLAGLLFGIHPMHVESVAWVSERKDVLHVFFFLLALLQYLTYLEKNRAKKYLAYTLVFFLCALFSKAQAVTLPVILVMMDYFYRRKDWSAIAVEKVPFFVLSLLFGLLAIKAQTASAAVAMVDIPVWQRAFTGSFALFTYLWMSILPIGQSAMHPYPFEMGGDLPVSLYASILVMLGFLGVLFWAWKKEKMELLFGLGFFFFAILPMLQFLTVGEAIIAERYSYLPYVGLFLLVGFYFDQLFTEVNLNKYKTAGMALAGLACIIYAGLSIRMIKLWETPETLWSNVIATHANSSLAYGSLSQYYGAQKKFKKSVEIADQGIKNSPGYFKLYANKGYALKELDNCQAAIPVLEEGLRLKSDYFESYYLLGNCYEKQKNWEKAIDAYSKTVELLDGHIDARIQRGALYTNRKKNHGKAIEDFKRVTELYPNHARAFEYLGTAYYQNKQYAEAMSALNQSIKISGKSAQAYYLRAVTNAAMKNYAPAIADGKQAKQMGHKSITELTLSNWAAKIAQ